MKLSIIVIEYHSLEDILFFDNDIKQLLPKGDYEIIVSSNSCYDSVKQKDLRDILPDIIWVFNERNGGFAYGMNRGMEKATGDYLMIANPDIRLKNGLSEAISYLGTHPEVGALGPLIKNKDGLLQDSARLYITLRRFLIRNARRIVRIEKKRDYSSVRSVDWVIGACIIISRRAYQMTGGMDEYYFLYVEDMDLCTSIRAEGLEVVHYPKMEVVYEGTRSSLKSLKYTIIHLRSLLHYWKKFGHRKTPHTRKAVSD